MLVNPVAGLGGRVGLKGTDGIDVQRLALERGAEAVAGPRACAAVTTLHATWPAARRHPELLVAPGPMGERPLLDAPGVASTVLDVEIEEPSSAEDTRSAAAALAAMGVDLLLFAGGDGTARDVLDAVGDRVVTLGIPAGVKMQSSVFATSPRAAGAAASQWLASPGRAAALREVVDLDEASLRSGRVASRLHGFLRVPEGPLVQGRKSPTAVSERAAAEAIGREVARSLAPGRRYVLGPGTTTAAIAAVLGVAKTLVGVDVIEMAAGGALLVARDASEGDLLRLRAEGELVAIVSPIGGQGFVLGRGNQPISPRVLDGLGADALMIVSTPGKLAGLAGAPLLVDTGDPELDSALSGYVRVITGPGERAVVRLDAA